MTPIRYLDVCSGYSAFTQGASGLGFECAAYAEIEPFPCAVLGHRYGASRPRYMPDPEADGIGTKEHKTRLALAKSMAALNDGHFGNGVTNFGDFTQIRDDDIGNVRLLVGGTPCQAFSIAGKRLGLDDPRGNLTLEYLALAKRLRIPWLAWENVPGFLSHDGGRAMGTFLGLMGELGYGWAYRVLDAQYIRVDGCPRAVPQRRKRLIVVGYSREMGRPEDAGALLDRGGISSLPAAVLFDRESLRGDLAPRRRTGEGVTGTLGALTQGGGGLGTDFDIGGGLVPETYAIQERATSENVDDGTGRGTPIVPVAVAFQTSGNCGAWETGDKTGALDTGTDPNSHIVCFSSKDHGADAGELFPTLRSMGHADSHANGGGQVAVAFSIMPQNSGKDYKAREVDVAQPIMAGGPVGGNQGGDFIADRWAVRRLTPVECARLMDVPDEFLRIPFRGKPASDGPIYKALGNSQARNMMRWLAHGLSFAIRLEDEA